MSPLRMPLTSPKSSRSLPRRAVASRRSSFGFLSSRYWSGSLAITSTSLSSIAMQSYMRCPPSSRSQKWPTASPVP